MRYENLDLNGDKCMRGDDDKMSLDDETKRIVWKQHCDRPLNVESP